CNSLAREIVPNTFENLIAPPPLALTFRTACLSEPSPQGFVLLTKFVAHSAFVTVAGAQTKFAAITLFVSIRTSRGLLSPRASPDQFVKAYSSAPRAFSATTELDGRTVRLGSRLTEPGPLLLTSRKKE